MAEEVRGRVTLCPDLRCHVYQMNDSKFDHRDARCEPRNTVGETPLIISYIVDDEVPMVTS